MTESIAANPAVTGGRAAVFHRWMVVAACLFGISAGPAAFGLSSLGLFIGVFHDQHGWTRTQVSLAASIMMLCTAGAMPLVGRAVDHFGPRKVLVPSIIVLALCFLALPYLVTQLWQFIAVYIVMGTLAAGTNSVPYMRILATWFDKRRGLAIGIAGSGTGLGFAYVPLVGQWGISHFGWQGGYVVFAAILVLISLPMAIFFLKEHPHDAGMEGEAPADAVQTGNTLKEAMRDRDFWVLGSIFVALAFVLYGLIPHLVPMLTDRGISPTAASQIASIFGLAAFAGRIIIGFLVDKFDARKIAMVFFFTSALGLGVLALNLPVWVFLLSAILLGGSLGAEVDMLAYLTSRYFGLKHFGQIFGVLFAAVMLAMSLGPLAFGAVYDAQGSYRLMLAVGGPICLLAMGLVLALRPYAERQRGGQISRT
jgi:MFS family permease